MIKAIKMPRTLLRSILNPDKILTKSDVQPALDYVREYWKEMIHAQPQDEGSLIGLPHTYVVPSKRGGAFTFGEQYYWDSFFIALGLRTTQQQDIVEGMLENLIYLFKRFNVVPNGSRMYFVGRSQPPVLTSFIFFVYDNFEKTPEWLAERIRIAEQEYSQVWMSEAHPAWHNVHKGLSRYYDVNVMHDMAEMESGWDMTPRFERKCLDFLPVDLNSLLYKYEMDFARASEIAGDNKAVKKWHVAAEKRKNVMNEHMWGRLRGFFFDYNYQKQELGNIWSLAGYYTMWAGMASEQQAARMVANL
jgi:alpha,alpha-trehalase